MEPEQIREGYLVRKVRKFTWFSSFILFFPKKFKSGNYHGKKFEFCWDILGYQTIQTSLRGNAQVSTLKSSNYYSIQTHLRKLKTIYIVLCLLPNSNAKKK